MHPEEVEIRLKRLLDAVKKMRIEQNFYFEYRGKQQLAKAKRLEREVDQLIIKEIEIQNSKQQNLF